MDEAEKRDEFVFEEERPPEAPKRPQKPNLLDVTVVERRGVSALVEVHTKKRWSRSVIPLECIIDGKANEEDLNAGDVSVAWEEVIHFYATPERLGEAFRRRGIFNREDLAAKWGVAKSAMLDTYTLDLIALLKGD